jgi:hypothetical protein
MEDCCLLPPRLSVSEMTESVEAKMESDLPVHDSVEFCKPAINDRPLIHALFLSSEGNYFFFVLRAGQAYQRVYFTVICLDPLQRARGRATRKCVIL